MRSVPISIVILSGLFGPSIPFLQRVTALRKEGYRVSTVDLHLDGAPPASPHNLRNRAELAASVDYPAVAGRIWDVVGSSHEPWRCERIAFLGFGCGGTAALYAAGQHGIGVDLAIAWYPDLGDTPPSLESITCPTQLYYGTDDTGGSVGVARAAAATRENLRVDVTPDAGYDFAEPYNQERPNTQYRPDVDITTWRHAKYLLAGLTFQPQAV